ncbi:hypothetical protein AOV_03760 [Anaplasma ovis str. Haibei]|uniref:Uncharacterized protein n=1 Tax=Anaplasma ovis str. Haibei TaxID=1248439 RepID=A0A2Z2LEQ5_9RICK|nr:hypothetical protein AOV_03760 [Anaplasma ovis str. Haibei]
MHLAKDNHKATKASNVTTPAREEKRQSSGDVHGRPSHQTSNNALAPSQTATRETQPARTKAVRSDTAQTHNYQGKMACHGHPRRAHRFHRNVQLQPAACMA